MSSRVPPSGVPAGGGPSKAELEVERPAPPKEAKAKGEAGAEAQSPEAQLWAGLDMDRSLEIPMKELEARLAETGASESLEKEEAKDYLSETHEEGERKDKLNKLKKWAAPSGKPGQNQRKPDPRAALMRRPGTGPAPGKDGFQAQTARQAALSSTSYKNLTPVGQVSANKLAGEPARTEKPPDAFKLLKEAREKGELFTEDALRDGHCEDQEDPALAEAVEECIRKCFGLRGILRIGPGKNDKREPIIVVAITQGFTDASLTKVPGAVNGFSTLVAIPFDLLPLKRER
ncbi:MAG: hypothetical protein IT380_26015 [Myxococcales bacterium]|nr:hypothetical protein [Myxococcales bacterium]